MATAKRLPSGSYRAQVFDYKDDSGKRHYQSFTAATKKEAEYIAAEFALDKKGKLSIKDITLGQAIDGYCSLKSNILSPATLREYKRMRRTYFDSIINLSLKKITHEAVQRWVNDFASSHSPKTTRNAYGILSAVMDAYAKDINLDVTLPQQVKPQLYVPTDNDIKRIIQFFEHNDIDMEIAVYLAAFGTLRRSEACAVTFEDVTDNSILINKAMVLNSDRVWTVKTTKTVSSTRIIQVPPFVAQKFPSSGRLVNLHPDNITHRFNRALKKLGICPFRYHDLRHYAASVMHALGIPDQYIMQMGGWQSDITLKSIYRGVMNDYQKLYTDTTVKHFSELMQHEMQHENKKTAN